MAPGNAMRPKKQSQVVKPKKSTRHSTASTKHHRFQSFTERVAKLKIDPVRRRRNPADQEELAGERATYFGRHLEEWRDLNLSETFSTFVRAASPLCDSLPAVLYNEDRIMDLLVAHIAKKDALALEPLLSLLSHFARDLDNRFEKHFQRAVVTITNVAATHPDPAVVEWSFTCLAWLFKFLSRLLVPDLRPLYDIMAPYLGKESQKTFVVRFAAESMSYLIRKAAALHQRDPMPLSHIISHVMQDCRRTAATAAGDLHRQGIMTLLTESIKGVQGGLHSSGSFVLQTLLEHIEESQESIDASIEVVKGTLTSLIHHVGADTFRPIQDTVIHFIGGLPNDMRPSQSLIASQLLFTIATVRKGSRVIEWRPIVDAMQHLLQGETAFSDVDITPSSSVLAAAASIFHNAPIGAVGQARGLLKILRTGRWESFFLKFCDLFARLGQDRFNDFLLADFKEYVIEQHEGSEDAILQLLPVLTGRCSAAKVANASALQQEIVNRVHRAACMTQNDDSVKLIASANIALNAEPFLAMEDKMCQELRAGKLRLVKQSLAQSTARTTVVDEFALGKCLQSLLNDDGGDGVEAELWPRICTESNRFRHLTTFWSSLLSCLRRRSFPFSALEGSHMDSLQNSILECLPMSSHDTRQAALEAMRRIYELRELPIPDVLETAIAIESTPISLDKSRNISMNIRRLANAYSVSELDSFVQRAIPAYCFGVLHLQLSQAWEDANLTLAHIATNPVGEDVITRLAQRWIESVPSEITVDEHHPTQSFLDITAQHFQIASDFECSNLAKVSAICYQVFEVPRSGHPSAEQQFHSDHAHATDITPISRAQALKVLGKIPSIAEKHSRMLVPILLRWAGNEGEHGIDKDADTGTGVARWTRKDQKEMLGLFARFTNPKVLFRSTVVYSSLLNLAANGDVEIQRSALGAILAWKDPVVKKYEENLINLLDEARFRDELSVFLQNGGEGVHAEDYPTLMPILLRLLYGRAVAGGKHGQGSRRKALFVALSRYDRAVLDMFLDIALGPLNSVHPLQGHAIEEISLKQLLMPPRQQVGLINMLDAMLETLGPDLESLCTKILDALLLCGVAASRRLETDEITHDTQQISLLRSIRQSSIQCLAKVFGMTQNPEVYRYAQAAFGELIRPRLPKFASENTQSISGSMRLVSAWASMPLTQSCLLESEGALLIAVSDLLREPNSRDDVRIYVLQDILDRILESSTTFDLAPTHINSFVQSMGAVITQDPSKAVLDACVSSLTLMSDRIEDSDVAETITRVSAKLLTRPSKFVSPGTKAKLLKTILPLIDQINQFEDDMLYDAVSGLFSRLQDLESRSVLSQVLMRLSKSDEILRSADICQDMNSFNAMSEEPDYERRERAFTNIYAHYLDFSAKQWQPILHNCLFYVRDEDDLVNRTSASRALERFIDAAASDREPLMPLTSSAFLPGLIHGMKSPSELVRAEYLRLLGSVVQKLSDRSAMKDLQVLTLEGDDEASFFTNALHIQQHRRLRALRRLSEFADSISPKNVTQIFIPLLEHFVFDPADGDTGRTLADQSILTLGAVARALNWSGFKTSFNRYASHLKSETKDNKIALRLLGVFVDSLGNVMSKSQGTETPDERLKRSETIISDFLPPMISYLHHKDETTVDRRMPVAVTVVKLLLLLPEHETASRLPPVLTDVCQVLRSRSQEARDQARKALTDVFALVGPNYLGFILKELRGALQKGYQLHVLSFTVHALLVNNVKNYQSGDLDECLPELMSIVMDDIFGITGQEKDAEEYKSGMREVKSSKSFDTMELLASITPVLRLGRLIQPLRALLSERLDSKMVKKIEDLLGRLRKGIDQNPAADNRDMLAFCHEIVRQVHSDQPTRSKIHVGNLDKKLNRYLVQAEPSNQRKLQNTTTSQTFKLASFALNLLRKVLRRHEDLMTPANLIGFLPLAGDALVRGKEDVQIAALKLLGTIMRVPMTELETNAAVYVRVAMDTIKIAPSMSTEAARASLETITAVLRDKPTAEVAERDLASVLKALKNDLDEPDRQGIVYKFLGAVLRRKVMIAEVYEIMEEVGTVMVTNADRTVREGARSVYLQFILDYPQGKDRLRKQSAFLVENLKFKHASGRRNVMELLNQLLSKLADDAFNQLAFTLFVALVPVQVGDLDPSCRQYAGTLIRKLFERADDEQISICVETLDKWLRNRSSRMIQIAALKSWMQLVEAGKVSNERLHKFRNDLDNLLENDVSSSSNDDAGIAEYVLQAFEALVDGPSTVSLIAFAKKSARLWDRLVALLSASHPKSNAVAARLLEKYFAHVASSSSKKGTGLTKLPLEGSEGLQIDANMLREICYYSLRILRSSQDDTDETFLAQTIRNLVFLGRCFAASEMRWQEVAEDPDDAEDTIDVGEQSAVKDPSALAYLFNRLSYIIRQENFDVSSRVGAVQCQASLIHTLHTIPDLPSVLRPLYSLTDPSIPGPTDKKHQNLADKARELLDMIQKEVGSESYINALGIVRAEAKERREGRRQKRRIEAVSAPERWARDKRKKHDGRKAKLSARALEAKGKRRGW